MPRAGTALGTYCDKLLVWSTAPALGRAVSGTRAACLVLEREFPFSLFRLNCESRARLVVCGGHRPFILASAASIILRVAASTALTGIDVTPAGGSRAADG
jgi:hypothetical protein